MFKKLLKRYLTLIGKINERHYWPLFIFLSLYFVVPYSEFVVTALILLYFKFEQAFRRFGGKITRVLPEWLRVGGSVIFFLVMLDDTLMYLSVIAIAYYSNKKAKELQAEDHINTEEK
jgi:uncharacterized membrane protein YhaH (DUF805 family)